MNPAENNDNGKCMLSFVEANDELIILRNECKTTLDVARHPWQDLNEEYYTLTRAYKTNTLTVVNKDGSTWSMSFGEETTAVDQNGLILRNAIIKFAESKGHFIKLKGPVTVIKKMIKPTGNCYVRVEDEYGYYQAWLNLSAEDAHEKIEQLKSIVPDVAIETY